VDEAPLSTRTGLETVMKILSIVAAFAASLAATLASAPAAAQLPAAPERVVVRYADLDLSSPAGLAALNRRVLTAVQAACGTPSDSDVHGKNLIIACRHQAFGEAMSQARGAIASANRQGATVLAGR
jgi:UrcA family protein